MKRTRCPTHPGAIILHDVLPNKRLTVAEAAAQMGVSVVELNEILHGERAVDAEWATRLGQFVGNGPGLWANMQANVDQWAKNYRRGTIYDA